MTDTQKEILTNDVSLNCDETVRQQRIDFYQIAELQRELDYYKRRLALIPKPVLWLCKHLRQSWWTISSLVGLSWLHNGSRSPRQSEANAPTISLPNISPDDMPAPRLFLDVTVTYKSQLNTGVQRVIRELCRYGEIGGELAPIVIDRGMFLSVHDMTEIIYRKGDKILLLDSGWTHTPYYVHALELAQSKGVKIILGIYDLIPIQHPGFVHPYFTLLFEDWLKSVTPLCSSVLAISKYSAESYLSWAEKHNLLTSIKEIGWFYLGANLPDQIDINENDPHDTINMPANYWLSIGTLEPRKGYTCALDAFDRLWSNGSSLSYVIIGRQGDLSHHIVDRIMNHPRFGVKLFWPQNVNDHLLAKYYQSSKGVLIPALAEGFGLPLIEACRYQKRIIASDLPVFKEIAPQGVNFFQVTNSKELAELITELSFETGITAASARSDLDWKTATNAMIRIVKDNNYQIKN